MRDEMAAKNELGRITLGFVTVIRQEYREYP